MVSSRQFLAISAKIWWCLSGLRFPTTSAQTSQPYSLSKAGSRYISALEKPNNFSSIFLGNHPQKKKIEVGLLCKYTFRRRRYDLLPFGVDNSRLKHKKKKKRRFLQLGCDGTCHPPLTLLSERLCHSKRICEDTLLLLVSAPSFYTCYQDDPDLYYYEDVENEEEEYKETLIEEESQFDEEELNSLLNDAPIEEVPEDNISFFSINSASSVVQKLSAMEFQAAEPTSSGSSKRKNIGGVKDTASSNLMGNKKPKT